MGWSEGKREEKKGDPLSGAVDHIGVTLQQYSENVSFVLDEPALAIHITVALTIGPNTLWFRLTIGFKR